MCVHVCVNACACVCAESGEVYSWGFDDVRATHVSHTYAHTYTHCYIDWMLHIQAHTVQTHTHYVSMHS